jgi:hypothetical protein
MPLWHSDYLIMLNQLIKHYALKTYGGIAVEVHVFLTSALVGGSCHLHALVSLLPGKEPSVPVGYKVGWAPEPI